MSFELDPGNAAHRFFSYASMVIPSNDAFVANGSGMVRTYHNDVDTPFEPIQDTNAFATCP